MLVNAKVVDHAILNIKPIYFAMEPGDFVLLVVVVLIRTKLSLLSSN